MMTFIKQNHVIFLSLLCFVFFTGCYDYHTVKPTEIPKLNNSFRTPIGTSTNYDGSSNTLMAISVRHLERPDGRTIELKGETSVRLTTSRGQYTFKHPTISRLSGDNLVISGSNRGKLFFPLSSIKKAEVEKYNRWKSAGIISASSLLGSGLMILIIAMSAK
jgi:hypothetical protein